MHELGHALGLLHEESTRSIMAAEQRWGSTIVAPQADDIAGVAALFEETIAPPPPNDRFSNATRISGPSGGVTGSNINGTVETSERGLGSPSVWWRWTAPSSGAVTIDTVSSGFDTTLGVYTGTRVDALRTLAENDDAVGQQSRVTLDVTAGTAYILRVAGYNGATGNIVLNWNLESEVASAQHKYIFPQFAFGGGWESTPDGPGPLAGPYGLHVFSAGPIFDNAGPFAATVSQELPASRLAFEMNGWTILKTATPQGMAASSGMAALDCDEEVTANTLFSLEVGGSLVAEAAVKPAEEIVSGESVAAQFLADHRDGARFGVAVANPSDQLLEVLVSSW